jgi:hypothetical protein
MFRIMWSLAAAALCLVGCEPEAPEAPETPAQAIQSIIRLFEARDFDSLVRTRYAEISKAENEEQIQALVDRFETRFRDAAALEEAISTYRATLEGAPTLSEDGTVATFQLSRGFVKLSRMPDGKWGFHL